MKAIDKEKDLWRHFCSKSRAELISALPGNRGREFFCQELTIASVKEKDIKPITMDARLIGSSAAMASVGHSAHARQRGVAEEGQLTNAERK